MLRNKIKAKIEEKMNKLVLDVGGSAIKWAVMDDENTGSTDIEILYSVNATGCKAILPICTCRYLY